MSNSWKFATSAHKIGENLFISNAGSAQDILFLHSSGITKILSCGCEFEDFHRTSIEAMILDIPDNTWNDKTEAEFTRGVQQLSQWLKAGETVLVHCMGGISRSATVILLYLMRDKDMTLLQAIDLLHGIRKQVGPVTEYWKYLLRIDEHLKDTRKLGV